MPRSERLDIPGALHHIMIRGMRREEIFGDDSDREDFLARLEKLLPATQTSCFAWALIPNHAVNFNVCHKRSGRFFQNRSKSNLCQEDAYLTEIVRYIHLNPLRA